VENNRHQRSFLEKYGTLGTFFSMKGLLEPVTVKNIRHKNNPINPERSLGSDTVNNIRQDIES
jgi:hypothetical protein